MHGNPLWGLPAQFRDHTGDLMPDTISVGQRPRRIFDHTERQFGGASNHPLAPTTAGEHHERDAMGHRRRTHADRRPKLPHCVYDCHARCQATARRLDAESDRLPLILMPQKQLLGDSHYGRGVGDRAVESDDAV